uniref:Uncharacterized protein n=1 Tax=Siphoviridae sp. ctxBC2 TaxID=2826518 RepID=A0A8S5LTB3_9CAUD|nr:MAG TPA: hypothetical protein [Siphoviridae sp. ctxBC2]
MSIQKLIFLNFIVFHIELLFSVWYIYNQKGGTFI